MTSISFLNIFTEILSPLGSRTTASPPSGEEPFSGAIFVHLRVTTGERSPKQSPRN
jgi:hypothetical protein